MTPPTAKKVANVILGAAALGAAVYIARTPALRRMALGLAVTSLTTSLPLWLRQQVQHAWSDSGRRRA